MTALDTNPACRKPTGTHGIRDLDTPTRQVVLDLDLIAEFNAGTEAARRAYYLRGEQCGICGTRSLTEAAADRHRCSTREDA